jgi:hypothetical protein
MVESGAPQIVRFSRLNILNRNSRCVFWIPNAALISRQLPYPIDGDRIEFLPIPPEIDERIELVALRGSTPSHCYGFWLGNPRASLFPSRMSREQSWKIRSDAWYSQLLAHLQREKALHVMLRAIHAR